ncbi:hypothetical protein [Phytoactinopolyspora limicola]|uniref:hypothetical protein n=1 Tax=Phytoactinopolyspora limicola TaxID=2715536 RepID=UPI0014073EF2|nr:hypothetical protein [Phytoactinopolyspora limicola]
MTVYEIGPDRYLLARSEDLLYLRVSLHPDQGMLQLVFPAQHVLEQTFQVDADGYLPPPVGGFWASVGASAESWSSGGIGGDSLSYTVPVDEARRRMGDLLGWLEEKWATGSIEFPALIQLAPYDTGRWTFSPPPGSTGGRTAVWGAELAATSGEFDGLDRPLMRVNWTEERGFEPWGFAMLPYTEYRSMRGSLFETRMRLSMLGASGWGNGPHWRPDAFQPTMPAITSFSHASRFGRTTEARWQVVGRLSSGHPVRLDSETTREFTSKRHVRTSAAPVITDIAIGAGDSARDPYMGGTTYVAAHLIETRTLTVLDPVVTMAGRESPFRTLRLVDETIHRIDHGDAPSWVTRDGQDVHFTLVATDWEGRETSFSVPLMFLLDTTGRDEIDRVFNGGDGSRRHVRLPGVRMALADRSERPGISAADVTVPVHAIDLALTGTTRGGHAAIAPEAVTVSLEAVGRLTDRPALARCTVDAAGISADGNFLTLQPEFTASIGAEQAGGLAAPTMQLGALNIENGAVPTQPPEAAFAGAKLLGVSLTELLADQQSTDPVLRTEHRADAVVTTYTWRPKLRESPSGQLRLTPGATLDLSATVTQPLQSVDALATAPAATTEVRGVLTGATLAFLNVITVEIGRLEFHTATGRPPSLTATGVTVGFQGDLRALAALAKLIGDFPDGSPVDADANGVSLRYSLPLPPVGFGVFSITNLALGAQVSVPFTDEPASVRFNFAERHAPFTVGVAIFGGGGFVAITATTKELTRIEASLEFGGFFSISLVAARGQVHAMGGVSLVRGDTVTIEGYLRCGGLIEVLGGIIGVSVEFLIALGYTHDESGGRIYGRATVTVGVSIAFVSKSVSFGVEKSFSTRSTARNQATGVDETAWNQLCDAFA